MRRPIPIVVAVVLVASALAGVVWGVLAPTEHLMVVEENRGILLTGESAHRFDALALFVCIGVGLGVVGGVGSWSTPSSRGPAMTIALTMSSLVGAVVAAGVGLGVGGLLHPRAASPAVGDVISLAPGLSTPLAVLAQPLVAALVVVVLASLSRSDDLRRHTDDDAAEDTDVSSVAAEPRTRP
ncbi:hypothetical protein GCM10007304_27390 [Rhodococcoides trifolii]|uniref:DUF2567 domain-containing protein n=2 Tax=Rhodococcoides trifolii TaxID=908250 RepID=A0A917D5U8_9NOCA|nr:hypothetical protein GCM10007304_27390 [Rhodococcus trifolii]